MNNELLETIKKLQGMGLGPNAYALCNEAITKEERRKTKTTELEFTPAELARLIDALELLLAKLKAV